MQKIRKLLSVFIISLLLTVFCTPMANAYAKTISVNFANKSGRVTNITSKKVVYRCQTGSSPESWARPETLKISSSTRFYECKGYNGNGTKYKLKKVNKPKAISAIFNNGSNYVFFKASGKTAKIVVYGMENFVG